MVALFKDLCRISLRNVLRNRKRSFITLMTIALGLGALIFLRSLLTGAHLQMVENITSTLTGDIQVLPEALQNIYNTNAFIENPAEIEKILSEDSRVKGFAVKVVRGGIVASPAASLATFILGIDSERETAFGARRMIVKGRELGLGDVSEVLLGEKMRVMMDVEVGDKVVVTVQDTQSQLSGEAVQLVGTFETGNDQIDNGTVMMSLPTTQRLVGLGDGISKLTVKVKNRDEMGHLVADLNHHPYLRALHLKAVTWEDLIPILAQMMRFQNGMIFVIVAIILTVVSIGILNTLMMSFVERIREFGLMMALGTPPRQILITLVLESLFLTGGGASLGLVLGMGMSAIFGGVGIDLTQFGSTLSNFMIGSRVYPRMDGGNILIFLAVITMANLLISLYPAWRASRLEPLQAMKQVG